MAWILYGVKSLRGNCAAFMQGPVWTHRLDWRGEKTSGCSGDSWLRSEWEGAGQVPIAATSGLQTAVFQQVCCCDGRAGTSQPANPAGEAQAVPALWASKLRFAVSASASGLLQSAPLAMPTSPTSAARGLHRLIFSDLDTWRRTANFRSSWAFWKVKMMLLMDRYQCGLVTRIKV